MSESGGFSEHVSTAVREAGESSSREIMSPAKRASFIAHKPKTSTRAVAQVVGISHGAVFRAVHADAAGRTPGKNGRPTVLSEDEEMRLSEWVIARFRENNSVSPVKVLHEARGSHAVF
jgi:hypothetical protein